MALGKRKPVQQPLFVSTADLPTAEIKNRMNHLGWMHPMETQPRPDGKRILRTSLMWTCPAFLPEAK